MRRLDAACLRQEETREQLAREIDMELDQLVQEPVDVEGDWRKLRDTTRSTAERVLGYVERRNQDWFDDSDHEIKPLLASLHQAHKTGSVTKTRPQRRPFTTGSSRRCSQKQGK